MKKEKAEELLNRARQDLRPGAMKVSIEHIKTKIGWWNTWRLIRSWGPKAKGKKALFQVDKEERGEYLDLIDVVERKLLGIKGFNSSIDSHIVLHGMYLEGIRAEVRLKRHSLYLTILSILTGIVLCRVFELF